MTIRDLEMFLYLHKYDPVKRMAICDRIIEELKLGKSRESIGGIYESLDITGNPHLSGEMDYFQKLLKHFEKKLKSQWKLSRIKKRKKAILNLHYVLY